MSYVDLAGTTADPRDAPEIADNGKGALNEAD
jgi:hypothetical protein